MFPQNARHHRHRHRHRHRHERNDYRYHSNVINRTPYLDPVWEHALYLLLRSQTHGEAGFRAKAGFVRPMNARLAAGPAGLVTGTAGEKFNRFKR